MQSRYREAQGTWRETKGYGEHKKTQRDTVRYWISYISKGYNVSKGYNGIPEYISMYLPTQCLQFLLLEYKLWSESLPSHSDLSFQSPLRDGIPF